MAGRGTPLFPPTLFSAAYPILLLRADKTQDMDYTIFWKMAWERLCSNSFKLAFKCQRTPEVHLGGLDNVGDSEKSRDELVFSINLLIVSILLDVGRGL